MWSSMVGGAPLRPWGLATSSVTVLAVGVGLIWLLPAPHASSSVVFPSSLAGDLPIGSPGGLVGGGQNGAEPAHAGSASDPSRVGGLLGFAGPLNTAIRGTLGNEVVLRVRADRPSFWIAETFDDWSGQSWTQSTPPGTVSFHKLTYGPPFSVPLPAGEAGGGTPDIQTFYLAKASANLIFHAANATEVWFPANEIYVSEDGTMRTGTTMGPGSIYTVESSINTATAEQLRSAADADAAADPATAVANGMILPAPEKAADTSLPHAYPRVKALAEQITAGKTNTYDKIVALEDWIGQHTRYTTDIPPLQPGQDAVAEFLFGNRRGYCEQISTALSVMLRSLGIPAREATGYVPGSFNPITDLYEVQAKDAHAWVQVWFPGYGWQSFDPTADVPTANPTPASALAHDLKSGLHAIPVVPLVVAAGAIAVPTTLWRRRRRGPTTWTAGVTRDLERAARLGGVTVHPHDPIVSVALELDRRLAGRRVKSGAHALAQRIEGATYGTAHPDADEQRAMRRAVRRLRRRARRSRRIRES
jgi:transglutaminase-like putative cysteine protease